MPGFVKIYGDKLLRSTLWVGADPATKVVWITMLALSDQFGEVEGSLPGLAHASNVSLDETSKALDYFRAPDPHSQTKDHEGRRIEDIEGGWLVLNYAKYREFRTEAQVKEATRKQKWREGQRAGRVPDVPRGRATSDTEAEAEANTEAEAEKHTAVVLVGDKRAIPETQLGTAIAQWLPLSIEWDRMVDGAVRVVFSYWVAKTNRDPARTWLTPERKTHIRARLKESPKGDIAAATSPLLWAVD
ncbi:hypothetical protein LCGC14_2168390, partial [marine sediment metagenome]